MHTAEVVPHEIERHGRRVVLDLLRERIGQAREAAHRHPHRQVLALDVAGRDVLAVRVARDDLAVDTEALRRAVPLLAFGIVPVNLGQRGRWIPSEQV